MYTLQEALAREHMRECRVQVQRARVAGELASVRRWHRVERRALAARRRHEQRAGEVVSAVAETRL